MRKPLIRKTCDHCGKAYGPKDMSRMTNFLRSRFCGEACMHAAKKFSMEKLTQSFWSKIDKSGPNGCWIWTAAIRYDGYGHFNWRVDGKPVTRKAHRLCWELTHGSIPAHLDLIHSCDNPPCVNPAHLRLGTERDNGQDAASKGRSAWGEKNSHAALTLEQVKEIIRDFRFYTPRKTNVAELAAKYGVGRTAIYCAATGRTWKQLHRELRDMSNSAGK